MQRKARLNVALEHKIADIARDLGVDSARIRELAESQVDGTFAKGFYDSQSGTFSDEGRLRVEQHFADRRFEPELRNGA